MLEGVLEAGGTASAVKVPGYVLAGKTGTAQKVVDGTYSDTEYVGSFIGFAPAEDPAPARLRRRRQPALRRALRRHRRGSGVRRDREVRAALPGRRARRASLARAVQDTATTPHLESARWSSARCLQALTPRSRATPVSRSTGLAYDSRRAGRGRPLLLRARAPASTATTSRPPPSRPGCPALVVERRLGLDASTEALVERRPRGDGAGGGRVQRRSDRRAAGRRHHRHQRQDDDRVPDPAPARGRRRAHRSARDGEERRRRASRPRSSARRPRRSTSRRPFARCSTRATGVRDGGVLARAAARARRRDPLRASRCSRT